MGAALTVLYPAFGALLGAVVGVVLGRRALDERGLRPAALACAALAAASALIVDERFSFDEVPIAIVGAWGLACAALGSQLTRAPAWLWPPRTPAVVAAALVGLSYVAVQPLPAAVSTARAAGAAALALAGVAAVALATWPLGIAPSGAREARRALAATLALGAAALVALAAGGARPHPETPVAAAPAAGPRPPIVLVVLDTVRADHLSVYGYARETSPNLAAFAARATRYTRALAPGDMTLTSHASLFTGQYASRHGAAPPRPGGVRSLRPEATTLAEMLSERGYQSAGVAANFAFFGGSFGLEQGFDCFQVEKPVYFRLYREPNRKQTSWLRPSLLRGIARLAPKHMVSSASEVNRVAFEQLDALEPGRPWLLFVNYMEAHWPYLPPPPYDTIFPGRLDDFDERAMQHLLLRVVVAGGTLPERDRRHLTSQYDGAIAYLDAQLGILFEELEARGVLDEALVVVTSDHGESFGERSLLQHGISVYQDQVGVPLIVKWPGQRRGEVVDRPVSLVDVVPSILDWLGVEPPPGLQGRSLLEPPVARALFAESFYAPYPSGRFDRIERALLRGTLKLVASTRGKVELYDLSSDPHESRNLAPSHPRTEALRRELEAWVDDSGGRNDAAPALDHETLEGLRALGYLPDS